MPQSQKHTHKKINLNIHNIFVGQFSSRKVVHDIWVLFMSRTKLTNAKIVKDKKTDLHSRIKNSL